MRKVVISGLVTLPFCKIMFVPDDEAVELAEKEENATCNVDLDDCDWDEADFSNVDVETYGAP